MQAIYRRHMLCCTLALGAGLFTAQIRPANALTLADGLRNPCLGRLPNELAQHDLVLAAFEGIDATQLWDMHTHLLGTGDSGSGCTVNPQLYSFWHPIEVLRRKTILNAACVPRQSTSVDAAYVARLRFLAQDFPPGARWMLFAFAHAHGDDGAPRPDVSTFYVPNAYAAALAQRHPERFAWVASVHPYADNALAQLQQARREGAVALKWLPSAMNIDLRDARCRPLYDWLAATGMPLIVHCGEEMAAPGAGRDDYGNPLLARAPLELGVRVVIAHCASLGRAIDLDSNSQSPVAAFDLFARLMKEQMSYSQPMLWGDISALFQANRRPRVWRSVLQRQDWHGRLLHGSDYPLPGVLPLVDLDALVDAKLLADPAVAPLQALRRHNPLLFDFVLKRSLSLGRDRLAASVFHTRSFFEMG
ncbi:MAG: amidohydrolase family protein [Burkholderiaceae bacterium]